MTSNVIGIAGSGGITVRNGLLVSKGVTAITSYLFSIDWKGDVSELWSGMVPPLDIFNR